LERFGVGIRALARWLPQKGDLFVDALVKSAGESIGKNLARTATLLAVLAVAGAETSGIAEKIRDWLQSLHLPF